MTSPSRRPAAGRWRVLVGCLGTVLFTATGTGCAVRYTDGAGRLHSMGLLWQTTAPVSPPPTTGDALPRFTFSLGPRHDSAALLRQRTVGVLLSWTDFNRGLAFGYAEQIVVLPAFAEGVTTTAYDSRAPLSTLLTFDSRLTHPVTPAPP